MKVYLGTDGALRAKAETKEDIIAILEFDGNVHVPEKKENGPSSSKFGYNVLTCPKSGQNGCTGVNNVTGKKFNKRGLISHNYWFHIRRGQRAHRASQRFLNSPITNPLTLANENRNQEN